MKTNNSDVGNKGIPVKYRILAAAVVVACFAVFFQNCGMQVRFGSVNGKLQAKEASVDEAQDIGDISLVGSSSGGEPTPTASPEVSPTPEVTATPSPTPDEHGNSNGGDNGSSGGEPSPTATVTSLGENQNSGSGVTGDYVCILEGPGKSLLLSYTDEMLSAQNSTPETVCTTEKGCLEIASKKFSVKEARYHKNCSSNKHMIHLTEETLSALVND